MQRFGQIIKQTKALSIANCSSFYQRRFCLWAIEFYFLVSVNDCLNENFLNKIKGKSGKCIGSRNKQWTWNGGTTQSVYSFGRNWLFHTCYYQKKLFRNISWAISTSCINRCRCSLLDGFGDGLWISASGIASEKSINATAFGILQATRTRISKHRIHQLPSCGRTLFLQETTAKIRSRTDHLKGVKIGIMGCIVNGPGEMADADYGYVGTGPGKITLYKGKEVVERNIDEHKAVDALIELIRKHGDWQEANSAFTELTSWLLTSSTFEKLFRTKIPSDIFSTYFSKAVTPHLWFYRL